MPEEPESQLPPPADPSSLLGEVPVKDLFARGVQTVHMTSGASNWQAPEVEVAARLFPGYEVLKLLGRGGMGAVYQARQIELDRFVAIKLLPLEISVDPSFADRFRREARAMARLLHPNIVAVFDFGQSPAGHLFIVMEYVEGANLAEVIRDVGLNGEQALAIVEQVCAALAFAHGKGVVHRDIKPANVMVDTDSHVKVADFGLARLIGPGAEPRNSTNTGTIMGTPDYMAPEQMKGMDVDQRADIYSVGVMLYEMLCREVPKGIFQPPSHRTGCDARIDDIVIKAMQQSPDRRYQSTTEMRAAVAAVRPSASLAVDGPVRVVLPRSGIQPARPDGELPKMATAPLPPVKQSKLLLVVGAGIAVVVTAATASFYLAPKVQRAHEHSLGNSPSAEPPAGRSPADASPGPGLATNVTPAPAPVPALPAPEPWRDALVDLKIVLGKEDLFERTPEGLIMKRGASSIVSGTGRRNGAIRIRAVKGGTGGDITLQARNIASRGGAYQLFLTDEHTAELSRYDGEDRRAAILREFSLPDAIQAGETYSMELRVVGSALSVSINGRLLGSVNDTTYPQGDFRVRQLVPDSVLVRSLEFLQIPDDGEAPVPAARPVDR